MSIRKMCLAIATCLAVLLTLPACSTSGPQASAPKPTSPLQVAGLYSTDSSTLRQVLLDAYDEERVGVSASERVEDVLELSSNSNIAVVDGDNMNVFVGAFVHRDGGYSSLDEFDSAWDGNKDWRCVYVVLDNEAYTTKPDSNQLIDHACEVFGLPEPDKNASAASNGFDASVIGTYDLGGVSVPWRIDVGTIDYNSSYYATTAVTFGAETQPSEWEQTKPW